MSHSLKDDVVSRLDEPGPSGDELDIFTAVDRIFIRLRERNAEEDEIKNTVRIIAPLDLLPSPPHEDVWKSYFAPRRRASDGQPEYPSLSDFTGATVDEWAELSTAIKRPIVRARFADAVWELGKRVGSHRKDLYTFARFAGEMYLEAGRGTVPPQHSWELFQILTRGIRLGLQLRSPDLINRGFEQVLAYAEAAPVEHIGLWTQPFDQLLGLHGIGDARRALILERYEARFRATVKSRDLFRIMMTGQPLAKHYYDRRDYDKSREITMFYGEVILDICSKSSDAGVAVAHIGEILEAYRRVGLRIESERVRLFLEAKGKQAAAAMKSRRIEVKLDREEIEKSLAAMFDTPHAFVGLYRLAKWCSPSAKQIRDRLDSGQFIAPQLVPTVVVGMNGLAVKSVGTYENDREGQIILAMAQEMNLSCGILIGGLEQWKQKFELGGVPDTPNLLDSILIPTDRIGLLEEGIQAFERGDYVKSIHVLIPQVENCLRELLNVLQISTTKTDEDGGYELKNINDVLHDPAVQAAVEEDLWYFLKTLYSDKRGMNLRNLVAHGIAPAGTFNQAVGALVVQSIVFLSAVRPDALSLASDENPD
jgi:lysyl-tRNA synthetase class 1